MKILSKPFPLAQYLTGTFRFLQLLCVFLLQLAAHPFGLSLLHKCSDSFMEVFSLVQSPCPNFHNAGTCVFCGSIFPSKEDTSPTDDDAVRRVAADLLCIVQSLLNDRARQYICIRWRIVRHGVDKPPLHHLSCSDRSSRQGELHRPRPTQSPGDPGQRTGDGDRPTLDLGKTELSALRGHDEVHVGHHLQARAKGESVDRPDQRLLPAATTHRPEPTGRQRTLPDRLSLSLSLCCRACIALVPLLQIRARTERPPGPRDDGAPQARLVVVPRQQRVQRPMHRVGQRVQRLGVVEDDEKRRRGREQNLCRERFRRGRLERRLRRHGLGGFFPVIIISSVFPNARPGF